MSSPRCLSRALRDRSILSNSNRLTSSQRRTFFAAPPPAHRISQLSIAQHLSITRRFNSSNTGAPGASFKSTAASPEASNPSTPTANDHSKIPPQFQGVPHYQLSFTCKPCTERSSHRISKQGFHSGTVLISCPGCKARHLIADHLKIFSDTSKTIEDILREQGDKVVRGTVGEEQSKENPGDIEFWRNEPASEPQKEDDVRSLS